MIETLLHVCGLCHDAPCHPNLICLLLGGSGAWATVVCFVRSRFKKEKACSHS